MVAVGDGIKSCTFIFALWLPIFFCYLQRTGLGELGKGHRNRRPRNSFKAWKAEHWPMVAALESGNMELYQRLAWERMESDGSRRQRAAWCIYCHGLMVVSEHGFHWCPYEREWDHDLAKAALAPTKAIDMFEWTKSRVSEKHHTVTPPRIKRISNITRRR